MTMDRTNRMRWCYLSLGTVAMLFMGVIYAWSITKVPLGETFGWTPSQLAMNYSVCFCFFCAGSMFSSYFSMRVGVRASILLGGALICFGYVMTARLSSSHVVFLYLLFGLPIGVGTGMAYNTMLTWISAWFSDKRGTCSGILMMGFGFSALVLGKVVSHLFALPGLGWRSTYTLLGLSTLAVLALCALVFRRPLPPFPYRTDAAQEPEPAQGVGKSYTPSEMVRRPSFWLFYVYGVLIGLVSGAVFAFAYDLCLSLDAGPELAATLVGLLSACNGLSRILTGVLYDHMGRRRTMFLGSMLVMAGAGILLAAVLADSLPIGIVGLCVTGLAYGYGPVAGAAIVSAFYGPRHFSANYSLNNTKILLSSFSALMSTSLLAATGSYVVPFAVTLCIGVAAFLLQFQIQYA